ncbi:hypothetical protein MTO96_028903 [Rhipicephalus appendiculatus]
MIVRNTGKLKNGTSGFAETFHYDRRGGNGSGKTSGTGPGLLAERRRLADVRPGPRGSERRRRRVREPEFFQCPELLDCDVPDWAPQHFQFLALRSAASE